MPKIIVISRYIKPNAHKHFGNFIRYIATREGVEKPAQKREENRELDREIFMNYLDTRPNSHGLFSKTDEPIILEKAAKEVANHSGAIWTHIVSLKREMRNEWATTRLALGKILSADELRTSPRRRKFRSKISAGMPLFTTTKTIRTFTLSFTRLTRKRAFSPKKGIEKIRSSFANDIYQD